jgi:hypothetical protein
VSAKAAGPTSLPGLIGKYIPLPLPVPDWSKPIILALLLLCLGFALRSRAASRRARRLEETGLALAEDIGTMQTALVPKIPARLGGLAVSVAYRPADGPAAGGDFYDVFELDDGVTVIILGDVSGHGRLALAHAARMRYTLRAYAEARLAPREVLKLAGNAIGTSGDGLYTTVVVAVHHARAASLTYASAGHPPPLFLGPAAHEPVTACASPPLGWGIPTGRRQTTISFPDGARACLLSDGLIEARAKHELLGRERVAQMFAGLGSQGSASMLLDRVRDFAPQVCDDMAACIIEAADAFGGPINEIRLEELELDMDQLNQGQARRFLAACELPEAEIVAAVSRTREIVADQGTGLLAVTLPDRSWAVSRLSPPMIGPTTMPPVTRVSLTPGGASRPQRNRILAAGSPSVAS